MSVFRILLLCLLAGCLSVQSNAQCCAAGNPVSADGSPGGSGKKMFEISLFYQHSYSSVYFEGDNRTDYKYIDYSYFDFSSLRLSYGITSRLKVRTEIGYFLNKSQSFNFGYDRRAYGFGDLVLGAQYNVYRNESLELDIFPSFDVTIPVGRFDQMNGPVVLPIDIQPSSGSFKYNAGLLVSKRFLAGKIALFLSGNAEFSQRINTDRTNYKYGNLYNVSLNGSYTFFRNFTTALQVRTLIRDRASSKDKEKINATGGTYVFLTPQLRYTFFRYWSIGFLFEYPIYKYVNGKQLTNDYAFSFRFTRIISFNKKKPALFEESGK
ncbi:MAG: transporter [Bacteroidota bacterium]